MSNYTIKFTSTGTASDPLSALKTPVTVIEGTTNTVDTSLKLCGHNYPNYGELLWTNIVHLLENFAGMAEPGGTSTIGQLWYDSSEGKLKIYKGAGAGEGYQYITGDDSTLFNADNFDTLLKTFNPPQHATPYFDNRYIKLSGGTDIGTLEFAVGSNIVLKGDSTVKVDALAAAGEDVVNKNYLTNVFQILGYDINDLTAVTSIYLPLAGGTMGNNAVITVPKHIELLSAPTNLNHAIYKGYAEDNFVSFGVNKKSVQELTMSGPLNLSSDSCDLPDDSLQAVPAQWVTKKLSKFVGNIGAGVYIPITATGTDVSNNLKFSKNNWITVDIDDWSDQNLVLNQTRANSLYVKKTGDTLAVHPTVTTSTTALDVPTCGWVNSRISAAGGSGSGGATASKYYAAGTPITVTAGPRYPAFPAQPHGTFTLTIPLNANAIDYEIRFGSTRSATSGGSGAPPSKFEIYDGATLLYAVSDLLVLGSVGTYTVPTDEVHSVKFSASSGVAHTLTVKIYCTYQGSNYTITPWIIADPLSATVAIAATAGGGGSGSVTAGPAYSSTNTTTYVDFGNGMVMISGITPSRKAPPNSLPALIMYGADITFPSNIKLQIPYTVTSTMVVEPAVAKAALDQTLSDGSSRITNLLQTGFSVDWVVALSGQFTSAAKTYYATSPPVHWTVTGFKA